MTKKQLLFPDGVGEKIAAISDPKSSIREITMYLYSQSQTEEQFAAVAALEAASDREAAKIVTPKLQRAFMYRVGLDGYPQKFGD